MRLSLVPHEVHLHPGRGEPLGVGFPLVTEHVVFGGQHDGRRKSGELGGA